MKGPLTQLLMTGKRAKLSKGQNLASSDQPQQVVLLAKGYVKRYLITSEGELGIQIIYGPEDVFPLSLVWRELLQTNVYDGPEAYHYKTMSDVEIYTLEIETLAAAVADNPLIWRGLFLESGYHMRFSIQQLENISLRSSYKRVAHQLVFFARNFGQPTKRGIRIKIPLTQQDIADILGMTRETVSISMSRLRNQKLLSESRNLIVPNLEKLQNEAHN